MVLAYDEPIFYDSDIFSMLVLIFDPQASPSSLSCHILTQFVSGEPSINQPVGISDINMSSSIGMVVPNIWKNKTCSSHHQSVYLPIIQQKEVECKFHITSILKDTRNPAGGMLATTPSMKPHCLLS